MFPAVHHWSTDPVDLGLHLHTIQPIVIHQPDMLLSICFTETESVKPIVQSDSIDSGSGSKLYQVEIIGPIDKSAESESVLDRIKEQVEKDTRGTQEELLGDMLVSVT
jgi:hypothetical protein